jgi:hypothetical protein
MYVINHVSIEEIGFAFSLCYGILYARSKTSFERKKKVIVETISKA